MCRWALAAIGAASSIGLAPSEASAAPIVMYYRWYDDPSNLNGAQLRLCDFNLVSNTNPPTLDCQPNIRILGTEIPGDPLSGATIPSFVEDPIGGIGAANIDADPAVEFVALTGRDAPILRAVAGELSPSVLGSNFADFFLNHPWPQANQGLADLLAVGFGAFRTSANTTQYMVAHTTNGADLHVDTFQEGTTGAIDSKQLVVPDMLVVDRESASSDFLGFTVSDDDGDGVAELIVLHTSATPGADEARISIFRASDAALIRTITLALDPVAAASAVTVQPLTLVTGFARHALDGASEWLVATFEHDPSNQTHGGAQLITTLWRYEDGGLSDGAFLGQLHASGVPGYRGAVMVGMAGLRAPCGNCLTSTCPEDLDGDAIKDVWEDVGIDVDCDGDVVASEGDIPLHNWANSRRKDIFLELDWFPNEEPTRVIVQATKDAFAAAPVDNLDGSTGISLWIDTGTLRDPQASEDGIGGWNSCNDGIDNGSVAQIQLPDGATVSIPIVHSWATT